MTGTIRDGNLKCVSLFSGIGGFDLAMTNLGHEIVGACEIDEPARTIYARHFPKVKLWQDATKLDPKDLPGHDILMAGFPCQAFSVAGKRLDFKSAEARYFMKLLGLRKKQDRALYSWKTLWDYLTMTKPGQSSKSYPRLMRWGTMSNGKLLTANIMYHRTGNVSSLSDILEDQVAEKYFLSQTSTDKIMLNNKKHKQQKSQTIM